MQRPNWDLFEHPPLAAALQQALDLLQPESTIPSLLLHTQVWDRFTPLSIISIEAS